MTRTLVRGGLLMLAVILVALAGSALGITSLWPVLLAAGVGSAAGSMTVGRIGAFVAGAGLGWLTMAIKAGFLPDLPISTALAGVLLVALVTTIAAVSRDRVPLFASLLGAASFAALYEPMFAANPTAFLGESPQALLTTLLAAALGLLSMAVADVLAPAPAPAVLDEVAPTYREVAA